MIDLTLFLAQFFGLLFLIVGLSLIFQKRAVTELAQELAAQRGFLYFAGMLSLAGGIFLVLQYNYWSAGFPALVITLIGWLMVVRGIFGLFASQSFVRSFFNAVDFSKNYYLYAWVILILGAYLTYAGFGMF